MIRQNIKAISGLIIGAIMGLSLIAFGQPQPGTGLNGGPQPRLQTSLQSGMGVSTCGPGDVACFDKNGVEGALATGTTDPLGIMVRGKGCSPTDTSCTPGNALLVGGTGIVDIQIDGADPSVSCAGDNDSVTFSVLSSNGTLVISSVALTEGTNWTATSSVANTCASLAAGFETACTVSGVDYCNASCTSPEVQVAITPAAAAFVQLTESTAGCTTTATLAFGEPQLVGKTVRVGPMSGTASTSEGDNQLVIEQGSAGQMAIGNTNALGPHIAAHTNLLDGKSTDNFQAERLEFGGSGFIVSTSPATPAGNARTFTTRLSVTTSAILMPNSGTPLAGHVGVIEFCGQGPNGATSVYLSPRSSGLWGDATCDAEDSTTETTADEVWAPFTLAAGALKCGINDGGVNDVVVFQLRSAVADVTGMTCSTAALDGSGFNSCTVTDATPDTVAAGATIAMKVTATDDNLTAADVWCRLTYSEP